MRAGHYHIFTEKCLGRGDLLFLVRKYLKIKENIQVGNCTMSQDGHASSDVPFSYANGDVVFVGAFDTPFGVVMSSRRLKRCDTFQLALFDPDKLLNDDIIVGCGDMMFEAKEQEITLIAHAGTPNEQLKISVAKRVGAVSFFT